MPYILSQFIWVRRKVTFRKESVVFWPSLVILKNFITPIYFLELWVCLLKILGLKNSSKMNTQYFLSFWQIFRCFFFIAFFLFCFSFFKYKITSTNGKRFVPFPCCKFIFHWKVCKFLWCKYVGYYSYDKKQQGIEMFTIRLKMVCNFWTCPTQHRKKLLIFWSTPWNPPPPKSFGKMCFPPILLPPQKFLKQFSPSSENNAKKKSPFI